MLIIILNCLHIKNIIKYFLNNKMENYVAQLFSWLQTFTLLICLLVWHSKLENWSHWKTPVSQAGLQARSLTLITNKNLKNAILRRFSDESVFPSNADAVVLKNGAALIFANFFQHCTAAEFVEITHTRPGHLPCQPTKAAELLLDGCKIEPYTTIIMRVRYRQSSVDCLCQDPSL
jgi:hypothetical protein